MEVFEMKTNKAFWIVALMMGLVLVGGMAAQTVKYEYKPPQNNFYIKWKNEGGTVLFYGYTAGGLWQGEATDQNFCTAGGRYYYYDEGKWRWDDNYFANDVKDKIKNFVADLDVLGDYYTRFWKQYNAAAGGTLRADLYHKGKERFLEINCDIFIDNMQRRYWIDPSNGCTLKVTDSSGKVVGYEVLEYNLNFTRWPAGLPPQ
jgi:hypothetical protein